LTLIELTAVFIVFAVYVFTESRIRSDGERIIAQMDGAQSTVAQRAQKAWLNIALFSFLLALARNAILYLTYGCQLLLIGSPRFLLFAFILYSFYIAILAWVQSSILEMNFPTNRAWYNRFLPNFVLDWILTMPMIIWVSVEFSRHIVH
jgi:hypothetical protein